jgi:hypothetical protein
MGSGAVIHIPSIIRTGPSIQNQKHWQHGDRMESRLKRRRHWKGKLDADTGTRSPIRDDKEKREDGCFTIKNAGKNIHTFFLVF